MPFAPLTKAERAEWQELLAPTDNARMWSAAILFTLSSLAIPLSTIQTVATLYLLYAAFFYYMLTRTMFPLLLAGLPAMLLYGISGMFASVPHPVMLPAIYAAALLGGVGGAFLMTQCRTPRRFLPLAAVPVGTYLISTLVSGDPLFSLLCLIPTAIALLMSYSLLCCRPLTPTVLSLAALVGAIGIAFWLIWLGATGWPEGNVLTHAVTQMRESVVRLFEQTAELYASQGFAFDYALADVHNLAAMLGNVLPGLLAAACVLFAYGTWRVFLRLLLSWQTLPRIPVRLGAVAVSTTCAAIFSICYVVTLFAESVTFFTTICQNLSLVLQLPLVLVGLSALVSKKEGRSCLSTLLLVGIIALFVMNPASGLGLVAFVGAFHVLLARFLSRKK